MSWRFDFLKREPKIEHLENGQVLAEVSKSREKARIQYPAENINRGICRTSSRDHSVAGVFAGLDRAVLCCVLPTGTITFAVVAFSIFIQGLTITPLLRRLGQKPER
jgi:hypothetical protein